MLNSSEIQSIASTILGTIEPKLEAVDPVVTLRTVLQRRFAPLQGQAYTGGMLEIMRPTLQTLVKGNTITVAGVQQFYQIVIGPIVGGSIVSVGKVG